MPKKTRPWFSSGSPINANHHTAVEPQELNCCLRLRKIWCPPNHPTLSANFQIASVCRVASLRVSVVCFFLSPPVDLHSTQLSICLVIPFSFHRRPFPRSILSAKSRIGCGKGAAERGRLLQGTRFFDPTTASPRIKAAPLILPAKPPSFLFPSS